MTKAGLIFDWRKPEGSFRDKLLSFVVVSIAFAAIYGTVGIRIVSPGDAPSEGASLLRFRDDELGRSWTLQAEEDGPFPGRLELEGYETVLAAGAMEGRISWHDYRSELRQIGVGGFSPKERISPKGVRVFPSRDRARERPHSDPPLPRKLAQAPVLTPYDATALAWMPEKLPGFLKPEGMEMVSTTWRFAVNLREDGTVRESISLGGGDDGGQAFMEEWLRGVRFKAGVGDRWLGLQVDFMNLPEDGTEPE